MRPAITFVVPTYNAERFIDRCVNSILAQTRSDYEVLLIDDGSTDRTKEINAGWAARYPKTIRALYHENMGAGKTRDRGAREARGTWVAFIDNDDYIDSDYAERFLDEAGSDGCQYDLILGGYRRIASSGKVLFSADGVSEWSKFMITAPWARIYRREYIIDNDVVFFPEGWAEDLYFNAQFYFCGAKIKTIQYKGYNWFFNDDSVSNTNKRTPDLSEDVTVFTESVSKLKNVRKDRYYQLFLVRYVSWYLLWALKNIEPDYYVASAKKYFGWLENEKIPLKFPLFSSIVQGEPMKNRLGINMILLAYRLHLLRPFASVYCSPGNA